MATDRRSQATALNKGKKGKKSKMFQLGSQVIVPFGKRTFDATVLDTHRDRVTVEIFIEGASEPLVTSYRSEEVIES